MAVTAYRSPGTITTEDRDAKVAWGNPTNAGATDDARAVCDVAASTYSDWLRCLNFGFTTTDIPEGSTIDGIEVQVEKHGEGASVTTIVDSAIILRIAAGQTGDNKADTGTTWPVIGAEAYATYGGAADTWNSAVTAAEAILTTFGVDVSAYNQHGTQPREASVDHVQIRVYYTEAGGATALPMAMHSYRRRRT